MLKKDIIKEIKDYIGAITASEYKNWYVGITNDSERRLFGAEEHNVNKNDGAWITCPADSKQDAQEVEKYFLGLGMDGDTGGGTDDTTTVYCYKKTSTSNP